MSAKRYNFIMRVCFVMAVAATLLSGQFEGSAIVASILGLGAMITAVAVYFYNRSIFWSSDEAKDGLIARAKTQPEKQEGQDDPEFSALAFADLDMVALNDYLSKHFSRSEPPMQELFTRRGHASGADKSELTYVTERGRTLSKRRSKENVINFPSVKTSSRKTLLEKKHGAASDPRRANAVDAL